MTETIQRVYDMRPDKDPRNRNYPARALLPTGAVLRTKVWDCNAWLDQGSEGACVGFGVTHEAAAEPVAVSPVSNALAIAVYHQAQDNDEWPGRKYQGTSLKAGMIVGVQRGWYKSFHWDFGEEDVALTVSNNGPVLLSIEWRAGMEKVDGAGFIHATGPVRGRHCVCCRGHVIGTPPPRSAWGRFWARLTGRTQTDGRYYVLRNSWSRKWGRDGDCYLSAADLDKLLKAGGEAAIPEGRMMGRT